jgi:hypothetical protein
MKSIALSVAAFAFAITAANAEPVKLDNSSMDRVTAGAQNAIGTFFSTSKGDTGFLISGVIYGNTSNPSGNGNGVLPSYSPGPWVCGNPADCAGPVNPGGSMGEFLAPIASGGTASPDFANSNDPNQDFSAHP